MPRMKSTPTKALGRVFDSKGEAERALELTVLQQQGKIEHLGFQPSFVLQPAFTTSLGTKVSAITYTADFQYVDNRFLGRPGFDVAPWIVEDYKGYITAVARLRHKMFIFQYHRTMIFRITGPAATRGRRG